MSANELIARIARVSGVCARGGAHWSSAQPLKFGSAVNSRVQDPNAEVMMRNRVRVLVLAAIVAAIVIPVDVALSLDRGSIPAKTSHSEAAEFALSPVMLDIGRQATVFRPSLAFRTGVSDSAGLFVLGAVLIGLAVAVRRAS